MPRPLQLDPAALTLRLQAEGPLTAQDMAERAGVDRSRVSRALTGLGAPIVRLGNTRGARYALRRNVRGIGDTFPIRRIDENGRARDWAELTALHGGWRVAWHGVASGPAWTDEFFGLGGWSDGFPFFLSDLRPQGYLGRAIGRTLSAPLGLPPDPRDWSDDHTLVFLQAEGDDLPGNVIVSDQPLRRVQQRWLETTAHVIGDAERAERYPVLAETALTPGRGGSSVEGEQPKFLVTIGTAANPSPVLVKFTDLLSTATGRRWADLLSAEAHAQAVLRDRGESTGVPRTLDAGGRRFHEMARFDRSGGRGRIGVVTLRSLHDALPSATDATLWPHAARQLLSFGLIDAAAERSIRLRHAFGGLIGNSDMHFGNLAFFLDDTLPLRLAPSYDMLPMLWAPTAGHASPSPAFLPVPPLPEEAAIWGEAAVAAFDFWRRVSADDAVSPAFREIAGRAGEQVHRMREAFT